MNYYGLFADTNDVNYRIDFTIDSNSATTELMLLDNPFCTEMEQNDGNLYKPLKCQTATARVLTRNLNDYLFDLYSPQAQKIKITLTDVTNNLVKWVGYVEPSLYDIGYTYVNEELEVNAVDGISSLQYFKYEAIGEYKGCYNLTTLLLHICQKCGCYRYLYLPANQFIDYNDATGNTSIYDRIIISEQIFFDEDGENEKDLTYKEAFEAIMQYLGITAMAFGEDVYCVDYDAIKGGNNNYYRLDLATSATSSVTLSANHTIMHTDYMSDDSKLSLDKIYQRASVEDDFYSVDSFLPDMYDEDDLIKIYDTTKTLPVHGVITEQTWCYYYIYKNKRYTFYAYDNDGNEVNLDEAIKVHHSLRQLLDNETLWEHKTLRGINIIEQKYPELQTAPDLMRASGQCAVIAEMHAYNAKDWPYEKMKNGKIIMPYFTMDKNLVLCVNQPLTGWPEQPIPVPTLKLFELQPETKKPIVVGSDSLYLVIEGEVFYQDEYCVFGHDESEARKKDDWEDDDAYITCSLKFGNKWWNGNNWQSNQTTFRLYIWREDHDHYINQAMRIKNNVPWEWQMNVNGTAIPFPSSTLNDNSFTMAIYTPHSPNSDYLVSSVWIKNFKVSVHCIGEENKENTTTTNTIYYNKDNEIFADIDKNNVDEFDTIKFIITTFDHKKAAYSCPCYQDGNNGMKYLTGIYNKLSEECLTAEQAMIKRIVDQYSDKTNVLELNLNQDFPPYAIVYDNVIHSYFIIDSTSKNYKYNTYNQTLVEKK